MTIMRTLKISCCLVFLAFVMNSCLVGPKYTGQEITLPASFGDNIVNADILTNKEWWSKFTDPTLDTLIARALQQNKNVLAAMSRMEQAGLAARVAKAELWPQISYQGGISRGDFTGSSQLPDISTNAFASGLLNWEIDLWGKYRHSRNIALAQFAASEYAHYAVNLSVESETARLYFQLLDYRERLRIAQNTLESRKASVFIISQRYTQGIIPEIDLNQATIQEADAAVAVPLYEQLTLQTKNALFALLGQYSLPDSLFDGELKNQELTLAVPKFLPADLLKRRPDIMEAEQALIAQYGAAGIAQSLRFPSLSLTMAGGLASTDLTSFLTGSPAWSLGAGIAGPLFHFGRNKRKAEIERKKIEEVQYNYEQVVLNAFIEVKNVLNEIQSYQQQYYIRQKQQEAARNAARLSLDRYNGGVSSYLELLDSQRVLFATELSRSQTNQELLNAYVKLYKALGGGW